MGWQSGGGVGGGGVLNFLYVSHSDMGEIHCAFPLTLDCVGYAKARLELLLVTQLRKLRGKMKHRLEHIIQTKFGAAQHQIDIDA